MKVAIHQKSTQRPSWGFHAEIGFCLGLAMEHYRCFQCYIPNTGATRITDTVKFYPHDEPFPEVGVKDQFLQTISDLILILKNQKPNLPFLKFGDDTKNALTTMATLLQRNLQPELPVPTLPKADKTLKNTTFSHATPNIIEPDIAAPRVRESCNPNITSMYNIPGAPRMQPTESNLIPPTQIIHNMAEDKAEHFSGFTASI